MIKKTLVLGALALSVGCTSMDDRRMEWAEQSIAICNSVGIYDDPLLSQCALKLMSDKEAAYYANKSRRNRAAAGAAADAANYCAGGKTVGPYGVYVRNC